MLSDILRGLFEGYLAIALLLLLVVAFRALAIDARRRGKSGLFVTLLVVLFFPLGPILWIVFRPDRLDGVGVQRRFRIEDHPAQ